MNDHHATQIFETTTLLAERGKTHGDYKWDATIAMQLVDVVNSHIPVADPLKYTPPMRHSLIMICFKLARILAGDPDFADHWRDIAGYATLVAERCSK